MDPNSYYALFIRVYVTDDLHTSTDWYPIVLTVKEDEGKIQDVQPDDGVNQNDTVRRFSSKVTITAKKLNKYFGFEELKSFSSPCPSQYIAQ